MTEGESICEVTLRREGVYGIEQREPIVRCRDCRHHRELDVGHVCQLRLFRYMTEPDGFCSKGERA